MCAYVVFVSFVNVSLTVHWNFADHSSIHCPQRS